MSRLLGRPPGPRLSPAWSTPPEQWTPLQRVRRALGIPLYLLQVISGTSNPMLKRLDRLDEEVGRVPLRDVVAVAGALGLAAVELVPGLSRRPQSPHPVVVAQLSKRPTYDLEGVGEVARGATDADIRTARRRALAHALAPRPPASAEAQLRSVKRTVKAARQKEKRRLARSAGRPWSKRGLDARDATPEAEIELPSEDDSVH